MLVIGMKNHPEVEAICGWCGECYTVENPPETEAFLNEKQKADIVSRMEQELALETIVKAKGFGDAIVTIGDGGVSIVVGSGELTAEQANQILAVVVSETSYKATDVKIIPYN